MYLLADLRKWSPWTSEMLRLGWLHVYGGGQIRNLGGLFKQAKKGTTGRRFSDYGGRAH